MYSPLRRRKQSLAYALLSRDNWKGFGFLSVGRLQPVPSRAQPEGARVVRLKAKIACKPTAELNPRRMPGRRPRALRAALRLACAPHRYQSRQLSVSRFTFDSQWEKY